MTNDDIILPKGTAYITDLGMAGSLNSIIGVTIDPVIGHLVNRKFSQWKAENTFPTIMCGVIATIDPSTGSGIKIEKIRIQEDGKSV
jgi:calcineurin-like phosphoesterase